MNGLTGKPVNWLTGKQTMKLFNKVAIIGVGLIGGSIALAMKKRKLAAKIIGVSRHKKTLSLAKKRGAIDSGSQDIRIIKDADLLIFATPVNKTMELSPAVSRIIRPDCIVTDAGSTKEEIVAKLNRIFPKFVGSHPLAGSEKRSIANACPDLFRDSLCILTPGQNCDPIALAKIKKMWNSLGAKTVFFKPGAHDKILSFTSHLPHLAAFSLIGAVPKRYLKFAASGLKDATRIAASDGELWRDIFLSNRKNMLKAIKLFRQSLAQIEAAVRKQDKKLLVQILRKAKKKREILG